MSYKDHDRIYHIKRSILKIFISLIRSLFLIGICFVVLYPLLSKFFVSFMNISDIFNSNIRYLSDAPSLNNYKAAFQILEFPNSFIKSLFMAIVVSIFQVIGAVLVGYGLSRFNFKGRNLLFTFLVLSMIIPPDLLLVPRYFQFRFFDIFGIFNLTTGNPISLIDTTIPYILFGVTCTGLKNGLYVFMMRQYFLGLPASLEEAANVDGAGPIKTFINVVLPGTVPMIVTVFLFSFVWQWNDSIVTPVFSAQSQLLSNIMPKLPGSASSALGLQSFIFASSLVTNAGIIISIIPVLLVYVFFQRFFVQSIERSGLVG